ncbi:MAG: flagellin [Planctomycetes bacterium]|nr:flagellin [Planctomycetota bacterium]
MESPSDESHQYQHFVDDRHYPAGLVASELLRSEKNAIGAAMTNISRANNVIATAEGGLDEVSKLLTELEDLVDRSANEAALSDDERAANQLQIDAILSSINRIAGSTEFQGKKLLSGELDYTTSGVSSTDFADVDILGARIAEGATRSVVVQVTALAQLAALTYGASATGAGITTIEVAGRIGTETLSFGAGTTISSVADAVNAVTELTGVSASVTGGSSLVFNSNEYGSRAFAQVRALQGTFTITGDNDGEGRDNGVDATVLVNGISASVDGLRARLNSTVLSIDLTLSETFGTTPGTSSFDVTGGGADFMISPTISLNGQASLGVRAVSTGNLGNNSLGYLSSLGSGQTNSIDSANYATAQRIIRTAQTQDDHGQRPEHHAGKHHGGGELHPRHRFCHRNQPTDALTDPGPVRHERPAARQPAAADDPGSAPVNQQRFGDSQTAQPAPAGRLRFFFKA